MKRGIKEKRLSRTVVAVTVAVENHRRHRVVAVAVAVAAAGAVDTTSRVGGRSDETTRN